MKQKTQHISKLGGVLGMLALPLLLVSSVSADRFSSTNYVIDASSGQSVSGGQSSTNYALTSSGGESVIGDGASGSYKLGQGYVATLEQSLQLNVQPSNLLTHLSFDEGTGTVALDSSASNISTDFVGAPTWSAGKIGGAVTTSNGNSLSNTSPGYSYSQMTVCSWAMITTTGTTPTIVSQADSTLTTNNMWSLGFATTSTAPRMSIKLSGTQYNVTSSRSIGTGNWGHVCATYDGVALKIYTDGVQTGSTTVNLAVSAPSTGLYVGARGTSNPLEGSVDNVKIYSRAFRADEVTAEYDAQNVGRTSGLSLDAIVPGVSKTSNFDSIIQTDAPGYNLAINQNHDLRNGSNGTPSDFLENFSSFGNGTTITTANTGFDNIACGSGTFTSSTATPQLHGTYGRFATSASAICSAQVDYSSTNSRYYRFYMRTSAIPAANETVMNLRGAAGVTVAGIRQQSDGTIHIRDGTVGVATSSFVVVPGEWIRLELHYNASASTQTLRIFSGGNIEGSIPTETLTGSATNGATEDFNIGIVTSQASLNFDIDDVETSTTGWLGPAGSDTIPAVSSSIASPVVWSEGTTKGLGFTLLSATPGLDSKWGTGANYAAFPSSGTTFYTRTGYTGGAKDVISMQARADITLSQPPGGYQNLVTLTGTMTP